MRQKKLIYVMLLIGILLLLYGPIKSAILIIKKEQVTYTYQSTAVPSPSKEWTIVTPTLTEIMKIEPISTYMGMLKIDDIQLEQFVSAEYSNQSLLTGVVNLFPERHPNQGNIVIVGHHMFEKDLFLGRLVDTEMNQIIDLTLQDKDYQYKITKKYVTDESNVNLMNNDGEVPRLTLITCDQPSYTNQRLVVEAVLIKESKNNQQFLTKKNTSVVSQRNVLLFRPLLILLTSLTLGYIFIFKMKLV